MLTMIFMLYNALVPHKYEWLNIEEGEGLFTGLVILILDGLIFILLSFLGVWG